MADPPTALSMAKLHATHSAGPWPLHQYGVAYSFGGWAESHLIHPPSLHDREWSSFPGSAQPNDTVSSKSVVGVKPGNSDVVIRYQIDEFTYT